MTDPGVGYPDWRRSFASSRFYEQVFNAQVVTGAGVASAFFPTANAELLAVFINVGGNDVTATIQFASTDTGTGQSSTDQIEISNGTAFHQSVSVKGPFMRVNLLRPAGADAVVDVLVYELPQPYIAQQTSMRTVLLSATGVAAPVGSTLFTATTVICGEALWVVRSALATYTATLQMRSAGGGLTNIDRKVATDPGLPRSTFLPPAIARIDFNNTTGAAGTVDLYLIAKSGMSGFS